MRIIVVIPSRYNSTRFPGKPLKTINNKKMIQHVYERASQASLVDKTIVATDDIRIKEEVESFNGNVIMTSKEHKTGTDRIAEAVKQINADIIVNVQGDEPLINPDDIDLAIKPLIKDSKLKISTLKHRIKSNKEVNNPNLVKVITDNNNNAIYFSRSAIPYSQNNDAKYYKHIGLYVYRKDFLLNFTCWPQSTLEKEEKLEQLRILENGHKIKVLETGNDFIGVDTKEDLEEVRSFFERGEYEI